VEIVLTLGREELMTALNEVLPMRLMLGKLEGTDSPAWILIEQFASKTYVVGLGLRVTCAARVHYPIPILPDYFDVTHVALQLVPEIVATDDGAILAFTLSVTDFDLKSIPAFVDRIIASRINSALRSRATSIAWDFRKLLDRIIPLPHHLELLRGVTLTSPRGEVSVGALGIVLGLTADVGFQHLAD